MSFTLHPLQASETTVKNLNLMTIVLLAEKLPLLPYHWSRKIILAKRS